MFFSALIAFFPFIQNVQEIPELLPMSESAIESLADASVLQFQTQVDQFLAIPTEQRTFENTIRFWDRLKGGIGQASNCIGALIQIHPDINVRNSADKAYRKIEGVFLNALADHPEIYTACSAVQVESICNEEEQYYLDQLLSTFKAQGMQFSDEKRAQIAQVNKEISDLCKRFDRHVSEDSSALFVSKNQLGGLDDLWISERVRGENGMYRLACDLPTYVTVLTYCESSETRKAMYELFNNRAFPQNEEVVVQIIAKRDQLAKLVGFPDYASYDLNYLMALSPARVEDFLQKIKEASTAQADHEFKLVRENLPEGVVLTASGQLERYDELYAYTAYKKKHFSVDQAEIAEYFPMNKTIQGLIDIYEKFFGLSIREVSHTIPIPDLKILEIRNHSGDLLSAVLLDLFPREGKCAHSGVCFPLIAPYSPPGGPDYPSVSLVIGNFAKSQKGRPTLLTHNEIITFFHEFGHAIHFALARNSIFDFCGMRVKRDFVELPSILLEKWVWDPGILKLISSHYLTGEPLPDHLIQNMTKAQDFGNAAFIERLRCLAEISLALFGEGEIKNPTELTHRIWAREMNHIALGEKTHFHASWWHLPNYGPQYYSYLWCEVFACDVFEKIQQQGLLNPEAGAAYVRTILSKGGSRDPEELLTEFLGRPPSFAPFFNELKRLEM